MKCPRQNCSNEANLHPVYGVLPCDECQAKDGEHRAYYKFQFAKVSRLHRVQKERDHHEADMLQPYKGNDYNPDFFKMYPEQIDNYEGAREALHKS